MTSYTDAHCGDARIPQFYAMFKKLDIIQAVFEKTWATTRKNVKINVCGRFFKKKNV